MFSPALLSSFDGTAVQSEDGRELGLLLYMVGFNRFVVAGVWPRAIRELLTEEGKRWPTFSSSYCLPQWESIVGGGCGTSFVNMLGSRPDLASRFSPSSLCYYGGRRRVLDERASDSPDLELLAE